MIKTYQGTIYPWNCDHMNHMNVKFYVEKFDEATWNLFTYLGLSPNYLRENKKGMVALEQNIKYQKEVFAGDNIYVKSGVIDIKEKIIRFKHDMYILESNEKVAETEIVGLHIDTENRKAVMIPEFVNLNIKKLNLN